MSTKQIDKVLNLYERLHRIPSLASVRIIPSDANEIRVKSVWSQKVFTYYGVKDVRRTNIKCAREFVFKPNLEKVCEFSVNGVTDTLTALSDNGKLKAVLRDESVEGKPKQFIEIFNEQCIIKAYDLSVFDVHGDVYSEPTMSSFYWSPDNTKLLYIAEKKLPKSEPFYKQKQKAKPKKEGEEEASRGTEYVFKPDWGEQLVGKHRSVVVILNTQDDTITPLTSIPDDYFPVQAIWAPNGQDVIAVGYKIHSRYLGLYACSNRESCIFHLEGTEFRRLSADGIHCKTPRLSPDGKHLVWLERDLGPAHNDAHRLVHLKWGTSEPEILVDVVRTSVDIEGNSQFYGIYSQGLPQRCWSDESSHVFFHTPQRSVAKAYVLELASKKLREIESPDGCSLIITDVKSNLVAMSKQSLNQPAQLVIGKFNPDQSNVENLKLISDPGLYDDLALANFNYDHHDFVHQTDEAVKDFSFTYFGPKTGAKASVPVLLVGHGGPHASYCNLFIENYALFALLGFGILHVNYRGSTGLGADNVAYLLGRVGEVCVRDCLAALDDALGKYPWLDSNRVSVYGGSYGGFLGAHLTGQYPDKFKAAVLLNPVIDIASMLAVTDIPDWCRAESGLENSGDTDYKETLKKMLDHSPIMHVDKVKTPTLLALGSKDLRVPMSQGKQWYYRLITNNVKTKLYVYEDNHSLLKDEVDIDCDINCILWVMEHNDMCAED